MKQASVSVFLAVSLASPVAIAQVMSFSELQQKGATKLSAQEIRGLVEGGKATDYAGTGNVRQWEIEKDGKLAASSQNPGGSRAGPGFGTGTWRIEDDGRLCVEIAWRASTEKWCRGVFRVGDKLYTSAAGSNPEVRAFEIEFRK